MRPLVYPLQEPKICTSHAQRRGAVEGGQQEEERKEIEDGGNHGRGKCSREGKKEQGPKHSYQDSEYRQNKVSLSHKAEDIAIKPEEGKSYADMLQQIIQVPGKIGELQSIKKANNGDLFMEIAPKIALTLVKNLMEEALRGTETVSALKRRVMLELTWTWH